MYIDDALGSTRRVFKNGDSTQCTFSATCYLPFGKAIVTSGSDKVTFAGEIQDSPTGLFYLSARYYDPELGRFDALDLELGSLSSPQSLNRYVYCVNNPLIYADPTGMDIWGDASNWFSHNWQNIVVVVVVALAVAATSETGGWGGAVALDLLEVEGGTVVGGALGEALTEEAPELAPDEEEGLVNTAPEIVPEATPAIENSVAENTVGKLSSLGGPIGTDVPTSRFAIIGETTENREWLVLKNISASTAARP